MTEQKFEFFLIFLIMMGLDCVFLVCRCRLSGQLFRAIPRLPQVVFLTPIYFSLL